MIRIFDGDVLGRAQLTDLKAELLIFGSPGVIACHRAIRPAIPLAGVH